MSYPIYTDNTCRIITIGFSVITLVLALVPVLDKTAPWALYLVSALLILIWLTSFLLRPTAYVIENGRLKVNSLISAKEYSIDDIASIQLVEKRDLSGSYRLFGIGGLFSYRGTLSSGKWGKIASFARGFKDSLVLIELKSGKKMLLSPEDESSFFQTITQKIKA